MTTLTLPAHGFTPRDYQLPLWDYSVNKGGKRAACIWHRRAGKDLLSVNISAVKAVERVGLIWHILPTYQQGRKIAWEGITGDGIPFMDYFPKEFIRKKRDDLMRLQFINGSIYQVVGGDQVDRLVGSNPVGCIFSEYALHNPECWDLIRPILLENGGWAIFIYTPRGFNHGQELLDQARESNDWFHQVLTIENTKRPDGLPIVTTEDIEEERRSGMPEELIQQEFYCDFTAPLVGSYFGKELEHAEAEGRIGDIPWRKEEPVWTSWDLGISDQTAIWFFQLIGDYANFVDYYAATNAGLEHYAKVLDNKPYIYKRHIAPHDIRVREIGSGKSRIEIAHKLGIKFRVAPKLGLEDGINAARMFVSRCRFDRENCKEGIKALRHYSRAFDRKNKIWSARPNHDWSSHGADSFRYAATSIPKSVMGDIKGDPTFKNSFTFKDIMDGMVERGRKERSRSPRKRWI